MGPPSPARVVDGAAATDVEGNPISPATDPAAAAASIAHEVTFLTTELEQWIASVLADGWSRGVRRVQAEGERGLLGFLVERLSGLGATTALIGSALDALRESGHDLGQPWTWGDDEMSTLAKTLRRGLFPLHVAVNKLDLAPEGVMNHLSLDVDATPCLADMELALRRADAAGLIRYRTGDVDFEVPEDAPLSDAQRAALERMRGALASAGGTGIEALLDAVVFDVDVCEGHLDYGGLVVLRHQLPDGSAFGTLYGHLDPESLEQLAPGQRLAAGDVFAQLGDEPVNGGWPPHLHIQLLAADPRDLPEVPRGVVDPDDLDAHRAVYPDPSALLGLPDERAVWLDPHEDLAPGRDARLRTQVSSEEEFVRIL